MNGWPVHVCFYLSLTDDKLIFYYDATFASFDCCWSIGVDGMPKLILLSDIWVRSGASLLFAGRLANVKITLTLGYLATHAKVVLDNVK